MGIYFFRWGGEDLFLRWSLCHWLRSKICFRWLILIFRTDWDMFEPFSRPLGCVDRFFIVIFVTFWCQKGADLSVCKAFIRNLLIKALQTLKSAHFDRESSQIWEPVEMTPLYPPWGGRGHVINRSSLLNPQWTIWKKQKFYFSFFLLFFNFFFFFTIRILVNRRKN